MRIGGFFALLRCGRIGPHQAVVCASYLQVGLWHLFPPQPEGVGMVFWLHLIGPGPSSGRAGGFFSVESLLLLAGVLRVFSLENGRRQRFAFGRVLLGKVPSVGGQSFGFGSSSGIFWGIFQFACDLLGWFWQAEVWHQFALQLQGVGMLFRETFQRAQAGRTSDRRYPRRVRCELIENDFAAPKRKRKREKCADKLSPLTLDFCTFFMRVLKSHSRLYGARLRLRPERTVFFRRKNLPDCAFSVQLLLKSPKPSNFGQWFLYEEPAGRRRTKIDVDRHHMGGPRSTMCPYLAISETSATGRRQYQLERVNCRNVAFFGPPVCWLMDADAARLSGWAARVSAAGQSAIFRGSFGLVLSTTSATISVISGDH
ncbi:hypothetical protein HUJ05_010967 [Dendroctonus ponderosae]|nr:hypothetical protein HUJ05_010967 [Dendroctonus ponderosae]